MARSIHEALFEPPQKEREARNMARREGNHAEADRINAEWARKVAELQAKLRQMGIDLAEMQKNGYTPRKAAEVMRAISSLKADVHDKMYEYWLNSILSAPTTQAANILGNAGHTAWSMTAERFIESLVNAGMRRPEGAQLGEFKHIAAGILPGLSRGARNFVKAWATEKPALETELGKRDVTRVEESRAAIAGTKGRVIRTPTRLLGAVDDFFKSVIVEMEVGAHAYRIAKAEGKTGVELQSRIGELTSDIHSPAWDAAYDSALEYSFQQKGGKTIQKIKSNVLKARSDLPGLRYILPFVTTPLNIFATGVRKTPLGSFILAKRLYSNYKAGKPILEGTPKHVAEQIIAWSVALALLGNDDDDPWITGTKQVWGKKREIGYRTFPPASIKIGGQWYSYARLEPFATVLGLTVDWTSALKSGSAKRVAKTPFDSLIGQMGTKTFLSGVGSLVEAADSQSPAEGTAKWASNFTTSWVPNVVRSGAREADSEYMNRRIWGRGNEWTNRLGKRTLQKTGIAPIKDYPLYDVWGRPAERSDSPVGADWLWRIMVPVKVQKEQIFVADRVLMNWNNQHPDDEAAFPVIPLPYYTKNGKQVSMTDEQYAEFCRRSGELARRALSNWSPLSIKNPTKAAINRIEKAIAQSRETVRSQMFGATPKSTGLKKLPKL